MSTTATALSNDNSSSVHVTAPPSATTDAFIVVDMQNDFLVPSGSLSIMGGEFFIDAVNELATQQLFAMQILTQDWHPENHESFDRRGGPWPVHCVQGTYGAALHERLDTRPYDYVLRKGMREKFDSYSAFMDLGQKDTGLAGLLRGRGIKRVWISGVASDYCVKSTAEDAIAAGFETIILEDLTAAVDSNAYNTTVRPGLESAGVRLVNSRAPELGLFPKREENKKPVFEPPPVAVNHPSTHSHTNRHLKSDNAFSV